MNSILMESNSPTQQRTQKELSKTIQSKIWDASEKEFPIEIEYIYRRWMWRTTIEWMDYKICPDAYIDKETLEELVRDIIREEEGKCEFEC